MNKKHLGIIGLGVMGKNLALNAASKGFSVAGYDADADRRQQVAAQVAGRDVAVANSLREFVEALETPRRIWMMVPAGEPVDSVLTDLKPLLSQDDIVLDGGNSHFKDTERRAKELGSAGLRFFGMGVSGGEEGALKGPCLMPGGHEDSYRRLEPVLTKVAAETEDGPCCAWLGPGGAGHYVKMVHNGIEYGVMQSICEAYDLMRKAAGMGATEIREVFAAWNAEELNSFLLEATITVLGKRDEETGQPLVDLILDTAEQKGTGKWASQDALDLGVAVPTLSASVEARILSSLKEERVEAAKVFRPPKKKFGGKRDDFVSKVRAAYALSVIACYAQGFAQMRTASREYGYNLKLAEIARIWKGGCIIRSKLLEPIRAAFKKKPELVNLGLDRTFRSLLNKNTRHLRAVVKAAADFGVPVPAFVNSLTYFDAYRSERLPANLLQAQRDYFGAHTYRRVDRDGKFHTEWDSED
jgi:6-phosphogluconate dehydrogenase